jgi:hypothetical protein
MEFVLFRKKIVQLFIYGLSESDENLSGLITLTVK